MKKLLWKCAKKHTRLLTRWLHHGKHAMEKNGKNRKNHRVQSNSDVLPWKGKRKEMPKNSIYINRELSWLKFNERVLEEAEREDVPLCERLNFLSIYQTNLDEFFMVRVGSLMDQMLLDRDIRDSKTNMTASEQISSILDCVHHLDTRKTAVYETLMQQLEQEGIKLVNFRKIGKKESALLEQYFDKEIATLLSPSIVGKRQPFPFLRNKEIYAAVVLGARSGKEKLGIIPCNAGVFPRLIPVPAHVGEYMLCEELILHFIPKVFKNYHIKAKSLIRITRNADIDTDALYDEDLDYREFMAKIIRQRKHLAPVRLELSRELDQDVVDALCRYVAVGRRHVFCSCTPLDLSFVFQIQDLLRQKAALFYPKHTPCRSASCLPNRSMLSQIKEQDKLLTYPFETMKPFLDMLQQAANDDAVVSIKITLYRVARHSKVVEALIEAAENGKEVFALVELKARFDEENNIEWSRRLEKAGCQVMYGLDGYKVHSKICLITRHIGDQIEYYTQIGTGNYNEKTARLYTDYCLLTANEEIGADAADVFRALALGETVTSCRKLMVAPHCLQNRVLEKIDREIEHAKNGEDAYIGFKLNALTDKAIIDRLIEASKAGVQIDMIIRGICCLQPGIAGKTDNIRVISIVGRFLEHSRIYLFGPLPRQEIYIASADLMTRNTQRRVEAAVPIFDEQIRNNIATMFQTMLRDNCQARELCANGVYRRVQNDEPPIHSQALFCKWAAEQKHAFAPPQTQNTTPTHLQEDNDGKAQSCAEEEVEHNR